MSTLVGCEYDVLYITCFERRWEAMVPSLRSVKMTLSEHDSLASFTGNHALAGPVHRRTC